jgi:hypothetical protein
MSDTETATAEGLDLTIQYPVALDVIHALAAEYMPLKIDGLLDKDGQAAVKKARLDVKKHRVAVEHKRKALKADALEYGRKVDSAARVLTTELLKIENHLIAEEAVVANEIKRIAQEEEDRKQVMLQGQLRQLMAVECIANPAAIEAMDDEQFDQFLVTATKSYEEKKARQEAERAEQKRKAEQAEQERKAEEERLAAERKRLKAERAKLEAEKAEIEAENKRIENERRKAEQKATEEKRREEEAEAEKERQKQIERMQPDLEKLGRIADLLDAMRVPKVTSASAQPKREQVVTVLRCAAAQIREITNTK